MRPHPMDDRIRVLRCAHKFFTDAPFSDDVFVSVDRGSGQMIRFSEKDLVDKYIKYDELCKVQFYLLPQLSIGLEEVDPNAGRGVTPKPCHHSALDYISCAVTKLINLRAVEAFEERRQVDCTHGTAWDSKGAPLSSFHACSARPSSRTLFIMWRFLIISAILLSRRSLLLLKALMRLVKRPSFNSGMPEIDLIINALPWSSRMHGLDSLLTRGSTAFVLTLSCMRSLEIDFWIGLPVLFQVCRGELGCPFLMFPKSSDRFHSRGFRV